MAVSTTDTYSGPYEANGVTVAFPFTFKAVSVDDVAIFIRPASGSDQLIDPSAYTVALAAEGGTATFVTAPASGDVYLVSEPSFLQSVIFASGQPFLPGVVNEVNDRDVVRALYLKREIDRAPKTPLGGGALGQYPVVIPGGGWGFSSGTGTDDGLRTDLGMDAGPGLLGFSTAEAYAAGSFGAEATKPYRAPSVSFTWWAGAIEALAQVVTDADMPDNGVEPAFGIVRQWNSDVGVGSMPYQVGRAETFYGRPGGGNFYTWNPISHVDAGWTGDAFTTIEVNANNLSGINFGDSLSAFDVANSATPWATPMNIIALGNRFTAGLAIGAPSAAGQCFNRMLAFGDAAKIAWIQGGVSAAVSVIKASGSSSSALLDMSGVTAEHILFMPNDGAVSAVNSVGGIAKLFRLDSGNNLIVGEGATGGVVAVNDLKPNADNARDIGTLSVRFKTIYLVNSPSVTSDPALKTDIDAPSDADIADFVNLTDAMTWRFKVGGLEEYEDEEDGLVPLTRKETVERPIYEIQDGKAVQTGTETVEEEEFVTEDIPVVDPVTGEQEMWQPVDHKTGKPMLNPKTKQPIPLQPRVVTRQVMVPGKVKVPKIREVPGKRVHIGFNAEQIESFLNDRGLDWGIVVREEGQPLQLRESRMIAPLWAYVKQLEARLEALEAA